MSDKDNPEIESAFEAPNDASVESDRPDPSIDADEHNLNPPENDKTIAEPEFPECKAMELVSDETLITTVAVPAPNKQNKFGIGDEDKMLEAKIDKLIAAEEMAMMMEEAERRNTSPCNFTALIWHIIVFKVSCFYWLGIHFMGDLQVPTWSAVLMKSIFTMIFFFGYHFATCTSCDGIQDEPITMRTFDYCSMFWMSLPGALLWIASDYLLFHFLHDIGITTYSLFDNSKFIVIAVLRYYTRSTTSWFQNLTLFLTWIGCILLMFSNFELNTSIFLSSSFVLSLAEVTCEALAAVYFEWLFHRYQHLPFSEIGVICSFSCVIVSLISLFASNNFDNVLDWKTLLFLCASACYEFVFYLGLYKTKNATLNQMAASNSMIGFVVGWHLISNHIAPTIPMIIELVVIYLCITAYFVTDIHTKKTLKEENDVTPPPIDALLNLQEN